MAKNFILLIILRKLKAFSKYFGHLVHGFMKIIPVSYLLFSFREN